MKIFILIDLMGEIQIAITNNKCLKVIKGF